MYRETLKTGEAFVNFSAGGAGWGDPANRDSSAITDDILDGLATNNINKKKEETS
jgi:N-methylhydantoinase B/oxoprolinase/acetone carboxylase alpha subunit